MKSEKEKIYCFSDCWRKESKLQMPMKLQMLAHHGVKKLQMLMAVRFPLSMGGVNFSMRHSFNV